MASAPLIFNRPRSAPPLENGDRLTREEFEERYDATPGLKKAELVEGIVYMAPPVSFLGHSNPHSTLVTLFGLYAFSTPGVWSGDNGSVRLDVRNMPQPDAFLLIEPALGGQTRISDDDYIEGAPELVAEIAGSSVSYDLHLKLDVYRRSGVREYVVWRTYDQAIDYFVLRDGRYDRLPLTDGAYRSEAFPGLWLAPEPLLRGDLQAVSGVVQQGIASPAHAAFVAELQSRRRPVEPS